MFVLFYAHVALVLELVFISNDCPKYREVKHPAVMCSLEVRKTLWLKWKTDENTAGAKHCTLTAHLWL